MRESDVISKGKYVYPPCDPQLYADKFVFLRENGKKYLLLQWENLRDEVLTGLDFTLECFGISSSKICEKRVPIGNLNASGKSSFVLDYKIEVPENCVQFKIHVNRERYGEFSYLPYDGFSEAKYDPSPSRTSETGTAVANGAEKSGAAVCVRRPKFPLWLTLITFALFLVLIVMMIYDVSMYGKYLQSFIKNDIIYGFENGDKSDGSPLYVQGIYGDADKYRNITIEASIDGHPVQSVSNNAFRDCANLKSVTFKGKINLNAWAFSYCRKLENVNFENVVNIGAGAFYGCTSLQNVYADNLESIGNDAFSLCESLMEVVIGESKTPLLVGSDIFSSCKRLTRIEIKRDIYTGGRAVFYGARAIEFLHLKSLEEFVTMNELFKYTDFSGELVIDEMKNIPDYFCSNKSIRSFTVNSLEFPVIGEYAFADCEQLSQFNSPPIAVVGEGAFSSSGLESFDGNNLQEIGDRAFGGCTELKSFELSENTKLNFIGNKAWENCTSLQSLYIPDGVEQIGEYILLSSKVPELSLPELGSGRSMQDYFGSDINSLRRVIVRSGENLADNAFYFCNDLETVILPDEMRNIGENAFYFCENLRDISLPQNLESIGKLAFSGCSSLTEINLPQTLVSIGDYAFTSCYSLSNIVLPSSLQSIGEEVFKNCMRLYEVRNESDLTLPPNFAENVLKIYKAGEASVPKAEKDGYTAGFFDGEWILIGYPRGTARIFLPESLVDAQPDFRYKVADCLFFNDQVITYAFIPQTVDELGVNAFSNCSSLETVSFALNSAITVLPDSVFAFCGALTNFSVPENLVSIGNNAFRNCNSLKSVVLQKHIVSIGEEAFYGCDKLITVYNRSALQLIKGSEKYGYVAYYAEEIITLT